MTQLKITKLGIDKQPKLTMLFRNAFLAIAIVVLISVGRVTAQYTLSDLVKEAGIEWMDGKWVAKDDQDQEVLLVYSWELDKHLIIVSLKGPDFESRGMIGYVASKDKVVHVGTDNRGGTGEGLWDAEAGKATLKYEHTAVNGETERMGIVHSKVDDNTMKVEVYELDSAGQLGAYPNFTMEFKRRSRQIPKKNASEPQLLRKSFISQVSNAEREYWLYLPQGYNDKSGAKWPVILFLHGGGERGDDIDKVLKHGPIKEVANGRDLQFIIIAPQMPSWPSDEERPSRRRRPSSAETGRKSMLRTVTNVEDRFGPLGPPRGWHEIEKDLIMILDNTLEDYQADSNRVYLTGLSYGGFGTWYMATHHPDRWAAAAPICGAGDNSQVHKIGKLPVWLFQGGRDNVVPPEISVKTADILDAAGGNVRVTVHEDLPHDCWTRVYSGEDIYNWFLSHSR